MYETKATGIITPNGNLELCYDERGHMYKVPVWCIVNPIEITGPVSTAASSSTPATNGNSNSDKSKKEAAYTPSPRPPGASLTLKVRINPGDHNLSIVANASDTLLDFKKLVYQKTTAENEVRHID